MTAADPVPRRTLGRTGLEVPLMALGTGGPERLGQAMGRTVAEVGAYLRSAIELGVNYIDTSPEYDESESLIGEALRGTDRSSYLIATKFRPYRPDGSVKPESELVDSVNESMRRLSVDHVDVLQLHGVEPQHYREVAERFMPALRALQRKGVTRFLGITEKPVVDPMHKTLELALADDAFDTIMVGYSILNQTAAETILPTAGKQNVGVIGMIAVQGVSRWPDAILREADTNPEFARHSAQLLEGEDPVEWMLGDSGMTTAEAGYRFVAENAAMSTVLTGTSDLNHLRENAAAVSAGALPKEVAGRIRTLLEKAVVTT